MSIMQMYDRHIANVLTLRARLDCGDISPRSYRESRAAMRAKFEEALKNAS